MLLADEGDRMKTPALGLLFAMTAVCVLSCWEGTPMLGNERCRYMPTVEACQSTAASTITDFCLRNCVIEQCKRGQVVCGAEVVAICAQRSVEQPEGEKGGYVLPGPQTCEMPKRYVDWCQVDQSPRCQELSMVHERAHACGWHHEQGKGVPGQRGRIWGCQPLHR